MAAAVEIAWEKPAQPREISNLAKTQHASASSPCRLCFAARRKLGSSCQGDAPRLRRKARPRRSRRRWKGGAAEVGTGRDLRNQTASARVGRVRADASRLTPANGGPRETRKLRQRTKKCGRLGSADWKRKAFRLPTQRRVRRPPRYASPAACAASSVPGRRWQRQTRTNRSTAAAPPEPRVLPRP
ncbi:MAG: hypothetical protein BJ554DRAFT_5026 [Olpidium bornovanus]|uniref:Uncharacterized protein n=1 Tax=Olpidium bornovanus TaxID=278681 RepID=A0A8H7ZK45_9FUNG|nr:MAG: hypothetical protein BJ554DRAFT_5026 [Olpidium bornovanus]